jgi:hypothetical protein
MRGSIVIDPRILSSGRVEHASTSPVRVSTAPAAPLPEKRQREQPLHRSFHLVTSALD